MRLDEHGHMPLEDFPDAMRAEIEGAVAAPNPPPRRRRVALGEIPNRAWFEWHIARGVNPHTRRAKLDPWLVGRVIARDGNACGICGNPVEEPPHIDHIFPRSRGGKDRFDNLQVAHPRCNITKGAKVA